MSQRLFSDELFAFIITGIYLLYWLAAIAVGIWWLFFKGRNL